MGYTEISELRLSIAQALLGIIVIGGAIAFALIQLFRNQNPVPPDWLTLSVGAVIGFYFANNSQQTTANIQQRTQQTTLDGVKQFSNGNGNGK